MPNSAWLSRAQFHIAAQNPWTGLILSPFPRSDCSLWSSLPRIDHTHVGTCSHPLSAHKAPCITVGSGDTYTQVSAHPETSELCRAPKGRSNQQAGNTAPLGQDCVQNRRGQKSRQRKRHGTRSLHFDPTIALHVDDFLVSQVQWRKDYLLKTEDEKPCTKVAKPSLLHIKYTTKLLTCVHGFIMKTKFWPTRVSGTHPSAQFLKGKIENISYSIVGILSLMNFEQMTLFSRATVLPAKFQSELLRSFQKATRGQDSSGLAW